MIQALLAAHLVAISTDTLAAGDRGLGWFGWFEGDVLLDKPTSGQ